MGVHGIITLIRLSTVLNKAKECYSGIKARIEHYREEKRKNYQRLITITSDKPLEGPIEYHARVSIVPMADLPREARHVSGHKGVWCIVDMEPEYVEYRQPEYELDEDGDPIGITNQFNVMTAIDYWSYAKDNRIDKGYEAVGSIAASSKNLDIGKVLAVGIAVIVAWFFIKGMIF